MDTRVPKYKRGIGLAAVVVTATAMLAGCTSSASTGEGSSGETTVTFMASPQDLTKPQIAEFEKENPGIKVNLITTDATRLNAMLAAGNPPDLTTGGAVGSANINARGLATNLDPYLAKSKVLKESDLEPVNNSFRWNGKQSGKGPLYGIVRDWSQDNALWYNTALFDKAGVPYLSDTKATSYDDLLQIAKKLTVSNGSTVETYGLGLEWAWSLYGPMSAMVMQQGGHLYNSDMTKINFTSDAARRAFQWYVDFGKANVGPTSLNPLADGSDYSTFAANRMAITQDGYWFGGNFAPSNAMHTIRFAPAPVMGNKPVAFSYSGQGLWIPAKAKNKDAAWKLMEFILTGPVAKAHASSGWGIPALKSLQKDLPQSLPYQKQAFTVLQSELKNSGTLPDSPYISVNLLQSTIDKYLQAAIKGQMSVDAATSALTNDLNKSLAQGKEQIG